MKKIWKNVLKRKRKKKASFATSCYCDDLKDVVDRARCVLMSNVNEYAIFSLLVSVLFILLTSFLAHCARRLVQCMVKSKFERQLLEEVIAAAELSGCCFELDTIFDNFGVVTYAVFTFALRIWWSKNWGDATACPFIHLEEVIEGKGNILETILKILAELIGGLLICKYVQMYWALEILDSHKYKTIEDCKSDLQVPIVFGAIVEGVGTCMIRLVSRALADQNPTIATIINAFFETSLSVAALEYSGGYFNPILATSLKAGCEGHSMFEHAVVYWIGPCAGSLLSVYINKLPAIKRFIRKGKTGEFLFYCGILLIIYFFPIPTGLKR